MRLELGSFPVRRVVFGPRTRWQDGTLEVDREAGLRAVREDPRIASAALVRPSSAACCHICICWTVGSPSPPGAAAPPLP